MKRFLERLGRFNKGCWTNIFVGILLLCVGSLDENIWIMFLGMINLLWFGFYWADKILRLERFAKSIKEVKKDE